MVESKVCDLELVRDWEFICILEWDWCRLLFSFFLYFWLEECNCRLLFMDFGFWLLELLRDIEFGEFLFFCDMIIDFEVESDI